MSRFIFQQAPIDDFRTNLPFFIHTIGDLAGKINFKHISLSGSYGPIHATVSNHLEVSLYYDSHSRSLSRRNMLQYRHRMSSSRGNTMPHSTSSSWTTRAWQRLILLFRMILQAMSQRHVFYRTLICELNSAILWHRFWTPLFSVIDSTISLQSSAGEGGSFNVTAKTLHGPLRVKFTDAPVNSILNHLAETFNSPVTVELPSNYEGSFYLRSSGMSPSVATRRDHDDPYRLRYLDIEQTGNKAIKGWTSWSPPHFPYDEEKGHVDIKTSNSPIHLYL